MNRLILNVLILSSVSSKEVYNHYQYICEFGDSLLSSLEQMILYRQTENQMKDCDYSIGFQFKRDVCDQTYLGDYSDAPNSLSAYLSDDNNYLYLYITIDKYIKGMAANQQSTQYQLDFDAIQQKLDTKEYLFVIWLKELTLWSSSPRNYKIEYNFDGNQFHNWAETGDLQTLGQIEEQLILKDFIIDSNHEIRINLSKSQTQNQLSVNLMGVTLNDSYLIFCGHKLQSFYTNSMANCKPKEKNQRIRCECDSTGDETMVFVVILFWCCCLIAATKSIFEKLWPDERKEKVVYHQTINLQDYSTARYKYIIIIRLSKGSLNMDLKNILIDVEFLIHNNESVAPPLRLEARVLQHQLMRDISLVWWRLTPLPPLYKLKCKHTGSESLKIFLNGVYCKCAKGANNESNAVIAYKICKNIVKSERNFILRKYKDTEDVLDSEDHKTFRPMPIKLTFLELVWILFVNISLICFISALTFHWFDFPIIHNMIVVTLIASSVALVFNLIFVKIYEILVFCESYNKMKMYSKPEAIYFYAIIAYYIVSNAIAMGFGVWVALTKREEQNIEIYRLVCVVFCASALFGLVWNLITHLPTFGKETKSETELTVTSMASTSVNSE